MHSTVIINSVIQIDVHQSVVTFNMFSSKGDKPKKVVFRDKTHFGNVSLIAASTHDKIFSR